MVDTGAARSGSSGGGATGTTNKSWTLHHFFARRPPPVAASSASNQAKQEAKAARPNDTIAVPAGVRVGQPTTPPTPAPRDEQMQVLMQRGTPPTPPSRPVSPRTPPSPPPREGGALVAAGGRTDGGGDDRLPMPPTSSSRKSNNNNNNNNNGTITSSSSGGSGTSGNSQQTSRRKMAPIFVSPAPAAAAAAAATKKASAVEQALASRTASTDGVASGPNESKGNAVEDEKDAKKKEGAEDDTKVTTAHPPGRKRPPLAPLFASPRPGADSALAMMKVTPSSSVAKSSNGTTSKKRPRTSNCSTGDNNNGNAMTSNNVVASLSRSSSTISSSSATTQLYLDLGQSNFAARSICPICGMMTVHGMAEDDAEHERICSEYRRGVAFAGWKNERVVATFGGGGGGFGGIGLQNSRTAGLGAGLGFGMSMANTQGKAKTMGKGDTSSSGRIVEIRPTDPLQHRKLVRRVKAIVDQELGFADSSATSTSRSSSTAAGGDFDFAQDPEDDDEEEASLFGKTAYLYISNKTVVGFCTVEVIQSAHRLLEASPAANGQPLGDFNSSGNDMSNLHRSTKPTKAIMGVHQLWCHSAHRKGKVATRMVDAARSQLVYGMSVPHGMVAFSSPTVAGLTFAKRYVETDTPLIYDCR